MRRTQESDLATLALSAARESRAIQIDSSEIT
jgi:hypothetical protein